MHEIVTVGWQISLAHFPPALSQVEEISVVGLTM